MDRTPPASRSPPACPDLAHPLPPQPGCLPGGSRTSGLPASFADLEKNGMQLDVELTPANVDDRAGARSTLARLTGLGSQGDLLGDSSFKGAPFASTALAHDIHVTVSPGATSE